MLRWTHLFGALALVLLLWTSGTAHAAEPYMPIGVAAESSGHFTGDKDEVPSDQHKGSPHHHVTCGEHNAAAWSNDSPVANMLRTAAHIGGKGRRIRDGRDPDTDLRPPIA